MAPSATLNFAALATLAGVLLAAVALFRRHHLRGAPSPAPATTAPPDPTVPSPNVCLHCNAPASWLTSFTCPACGRDVRAAGLGPPRTHSRLRVFWTLVVYTCAYLLAVMFLGGFLLDRLPRQTVTATHVSMNLSSPQLRGVDLYLDTTGPDESRRGALTADLFGPAGIVVLHLDIPAANIGPNTPNTAAYRWRLLDASNKQLDAGEHLDGTTIYRWMELAGVPTHSAIGHSDANHIAAAVGRLLGTRLDMPPVPDTGRALSLSYSSSTSGGTTTLHDPRWPPLLVIATCLLWLAGFSLILRSRRAARAPEFAAVTDTAAPAPQGATP